jgi:hypothetical protein
MDERSRKLLQRNPDHIRERLEESRAEISHAVLALRDVVATRLDWKGLVRRRPAMLLLSAFTIGFAFARRPSRREDE